MSLTKGGRGRFITKKRVKSKTKTKTKTKTKGISRRGRTRRGRGAGQSTISDKKIELMEEGKPWYTAPSKEGLIVNPNLDAATSAQRDNDYMDYEAADDQGLTFGGKQKSKRRKSTRRRIYRRR